MPRKSQPRFPPPQCAYCGNSSDHQDHVFPKALFRELGSHAVTVKACTPCGKRKSRYDAYFRDGLVTDFRCHSHPVARDKFVNEFQRAVVGKQSRFADDFMVRSVPHLVRDENGRQPVTFHFLPVDPDFEIELEFILRGLTRYASPSLTVARDAVIQTGQLTPRAAAQSMEYSAAQMGGLQGPFMRDDFVVEWAFQIANENLSLWWLCFYGAVSYIGSIQPPGREPIPLEKAGAWGSS